jgi:hypothetical protein
VTHQRDGHPYDRQAAEEAQPTGSAPSLSLPKDGGAVRRRGEKVADNHVTGTGARMMLMGTNSGCAGSSAQRSLRRLHAEIVRGALNALAAPLPDVSEDYSGGPA